MLLHFQLQELKTKGLSGSVLTALWQLKLPKLRDTMAFPNTSDISSWLCHLPQPLPALSLLGQFCTSALGVLRLRDTQVLLSGGVRAGPGQALECDGWHTAPVSRAQRAGPGAPAPRVPHVHSIPHPRYVPAVSPGSTWQPLFRPCWWRRAFLAG